MRKVKGNFIYDNKNYDVKIKVQQVYGIFDVFEKFFLKEKFDHVLEIGMSHGGLSLFLYEQSLKYNFCFQTYDKRNEIVSFVL